VESEIEFFCDECGLQVDEDQRLGKQYICQKCLYKKMDEAVDRYDQEKRDTEVADGNGP